MYFASTTKSLSNEHFEYLVTNCPLNCLQDVLKNLVTCFDITDQYLATAREAWVAAGVDERIEVVVGPAAQTLRGLSDEPAIGMAFIDADKSGYQSYLDLLMPRMDPAGVIVVDNVMWSGRVIDPAADDRDTIAIREFNDAVARREDCEAIMLPIGDGVTLIRPRPRRAR